MSEYHFDPSKRVRVPVYDHEFASVPSRWTEIPEWLLPVWNPDPPKDGGRLIPESMEAAIYGSLTWRSPYRPDDLPYAFLTRRERLNRWFRWWFRR